VVLAVTLAFAGPAAAVQVDATWIGGAGNWSTATDWDIGVVPDNNGDTYNVLIDDGDTGTASVLWLNMNARIDNLTIDTGDWLGIDTGLDLGIAGTSISNAGVLWLGSGSSANTDLVIANEVTLTGGGTIGASNNWWNRIVDDSGNDGHLINNDNIIEGSGRVGDNTLQLTNRGTVRANQSVRLAIDPNANGVLNTGTLQATNNATLLLQNGTFTNHEGATLGLIEAQNGSSVELDGAHVVGGVLSTSGTGVIETAGSSGATLEDLANQGTYRIHTADDTTLIGTINNTGTINLAAGSAANTDLIIADEVTLTGGGTVSSTNHWHNRIVDDSGNDGHLINNDNIIEGSGRVGDNTLQLTNRSTVRANQSVRLAINPNANGVLNTGTLQATNNAILLLQDGTFTNHEGATLGLIEAQNGSSVELDGAHVIGGVLTTSGTGVIETAGSGGATLEDLANQGLYRVNSADDTALIGTINNTGAINVAAGSSAWTELHVDGQATLTGAGSLTMSNNSYNRIEDPTGEDGHLTNAADHTIEGSGYIGYISHKIQLTNRGTIRGNQPKLLRVMPNAQGILNTGTMEAASGGELRLIGGVCTNFEGGDDGVIQALNGSSVSLDDAHIVGGVLTTSGTGVIETAGSGVPTLENLANQGLYRINGSTDTALVGTINNTGIINVNATSSSATELHVDGQATLTGAGKVMMSDNGYNRIKDPTGEDGHLTNAADHTIEGAGYVGYISQKLQLTNRGTIRGNLSTRLRVMPNAQGILNTGTMEAASGGELRLVGGLCTNFEGGDDGVIQALDGSSVSLDDAHVVGGILTTSGTGVIETAGSGVPTLENLANQGLYRVNGGHDTALIGTINNTGIINVNATSSSATKLHVDGQGTLTGAGKVMMSDNAYNRIEDPTGEDGHLVNETGHTIEGAGYVGYTSHKLQLTNRGVIEATGSSKLYVIPNASGALNDAGGVLRGSGTGGLELRVGSFNNLGTVEALNGSAVTYANTATTANNVAGVLTNGTWRSVSASGGATVSLMGDAVTEIAANTEVELSGAGSTLRVRQGTSSNFTPLESSLTTNEGTLRVLDNRNYTNTNALSNEATGVVELGGGTLDAPSIANAGEMFGYGAITPQPTNSGTIRAVGGTLTMANGILGGSGTVQIDPGSSLDLSGAGGDSDADFLIHNGDDLNLGANDFNVHVDYTNANWGSGNSFNHLANVTSASGQINADADTVQALAGDVADGGTPTAEMDFENVHVGDVVTKHYAVRHNGTSTTNLRGAIQTAVNPHFSPGSERAGRRAM